MTEQVAARKLTAIEVRRTVDPASLPFATTAEIDPTVETIGQPRALDAIEFGLEADGHGFNMYIAGSSGTGREDTVLDQIREHASRRPTPPDWIYVHNFEIADAPIAISLPAGDGRKFAQSMHELLQSIQREIPRAFESEEVQNRRDQAIALTNERRAAMFEALGQFARDRAYAVELKQTGVMTIPLVDDKPIETEAFRQLPQETRDAIQRRGEEVQAEVTQTMRQVRKLDRETMDALHQIEREVVAFVTDPLFEDLREDYERNEEIVAFLEKTRADIPEHLHDFWPVEQPSDDGPSAEFFATRRGEHLGRYEVNVLVDNGELKGAPVVLERNPTFPNLLGRIEFRAVFGAMVTDFRQIKPGALHKANGGFLVAHIKDILRNPLAWETLKRVLISREIEIESMTEQFSISFAGRLRPEPIPVEVKVVLIGGRQLYQMLYQLDEDFAELFGVRADFAPDMVWSDEHVAEYAAYIARQVRENQLIHFDAAAVARVVEQGSRLREHQRKLSTRFLDIANLITESCHWARKSGHDPVMASDVDQAIAKREYRSNLSEQMYQELIDDQTLAIAIGGSAVGQVNGLAIIDLGDYAFGKPSRISARVSAGRDGVQSIERDIELSGPIHSKGVLILSGYLNGQYGVSAPVTLKATITFEQTYEEIDGDSASSTELYALLSALADVPLKQGIAVTGSVDQFGRVQAVGGVTRKIEGFFETCLHRGLTGEQGVIIPRANIQNLMLKRDVVQAIDAGQFHVWAVESIDEGIELLSGVAAGTRSKAGSFPARSIHAMVQARLDAFRESSENGHRKPSTRSKRQRSGEKSA